MLRKYKGSAFNLVYFRITFDEIATMQEIVISLDFPAPVDVLRWAEEVG